MTSQHGLQIYFNPLHHEGGDSFPEDGGYVYADFNPLHHEGGDKIVLQLLFASLDFNPLHHEGGDMTDDEFLFQLQSFQSTPPRGWRPMNTLKIFGD